MFDMPGVFVGHDVGFAVQEDGVEEVGDVGFAVVGLLDSCGKGWWGGEGGEGGGKVKVKGRWRMMEGWKRRKEESSENMDPTPYTNQRKPPLHIQNKGKLTI